MTKQEFMNIAEQYEGTIINENGGGRVKVDIYNTDKKYNIIYADPPWSYKVWSKKGMGRSAENHYNTMSKDEIQGMANTIEKLADKDAVLFLWVTAPCLMEGMELIEKWGFTYKTIGFTWIKQNKIADSLFWGMG